MVEEAKDQTNEVTQPKADNCEESVVLSWQDWIAFAMNSLIFAVLFLIAFGYFRSETPTSIPFRFRAKIAELCNGISNIQFPYSINIVFFGGILRTVIYSILLSPLIYVFNNVFQPRLEHLRNRNPKAGIAIWSSALFGYFIFVIGYSIWEAADSNWSNWRGITLLIVTLLAACYVKIYLWATEQNQTNISTVVKTAETNADAVNKTKSSKSPQEKANQVEPLSITDEIVLAWLESDDPTKYDLLGTRLAEKSQQLVNLIVNQKKDQRVRSIGIIGRYGTGKSSMVNFLRKEIEKPANRGKFIFCQVSTWRFDESATAIQHILTEMLREIGKEIDTFRVRKLPDTFRKGYSTFGGELLDKLSDMLFGDESLESRLKKLDGMLRRAGQSVILVVEDLDRNHDTKFDPYQVQAFLFLLKTIPSIIPIISGDEEITTKNQIDFAKLCDYRLEIDEPSSQRTALLIKHVKNICGGNELSNDKTLHQFHANFWDWISDYDYTVDIPGIVLAIISILRTPRDLKHALRRTLINYSGDLKGEVDWDHLLITNVIRHNHLRIIAFADQYFMSIKKISPEDVIGWIQSNESNRKERYANCEHLSIKWKDIVAGDLRISPKIKIALEVALTYLFDAFPSSLIIKPSWGSHWPPKKPQGAMSFRHWQRIRLEYKHPSDPKDTDIIKQYSEWIDKIPTNKFIDKITSDIPFLEGFQDLAESLRPRSFENRSDLLHDAIFGYCNPIDPKTKLNPKSIHAACDLYESQLLFQNNKSDIIQTDSTKSYFMELISISAKSNLRACAILYSTIIRIYEREKTIYTMLKEHLISEVISAANIAPGIDNLINDSDSDVLFDLILVIASFENTADVLTKWKPIGPFLFDSVRKGNNATFKAVYSFLTHKGQISNSGIDSSLGKALFGKQFTTLLGIIDETMGRKDNIS